MKKDALVSVIIPMYNVEKYIENCVRSVLEQTYVNIELILIDDGSPDKSGEIAECLALDDERIQVIRKQNEGVSRARNIGIEKSNGDYLIFVDSDDYLQPDYISYMMSLAESSCAEFIMSKNCRLFPTNEKVKDDISDIIELWAPERAAAELLYPGRIEIGCWNKLFLKSFIVNNNIEFPENLYMGEGLNFIVNAAQKANKVCVGNRRVYNYRKDNQQSATTVVNIPKYVNALSALDDIDNNKIINSSIMNMSLMYHKYMTTYLALHTIFVTRENEKYKKEVSEYKRYLRKHYFNFLRADFPVPLKIKITLFSISPHVAVKSIRLIKKTLLR
ncbi:TPA: glycosyltransferase family 2 protein [Vibrio parahaemolyticus]|nr:glycosyltransferase family 2 protein [Vibrio parahaemolyticus]MDF5621120.1 glycosyltransferase family 2 protein [Vibrio parahaemolyticus]HCH2936828.1 glycosyltransferase family 2 protein [Vibrio parahaemolyticus]